MQFKVESDILLPIFHTAQQRGFWELGPQTWREAALEFWNCALLAWEKSALLGFHLGGLKGRKTEPAGCWDSSSATVQDLIVLYRAGD